MMMRSWLVGVVPMLVLVCDVDAFTVSSMTASIRSRNGRMNRQWMANSDVEEYKNLPTQILSKFFPSAKDEEEDKEDPLNDIDWDAPKYTSFTDLETLAQILDVELYESEWFVTGKVNPIYFSNDFEFEDPDVQLSGIEEYARGVAKLFDAETARAEIISTKVSEEEENMITVTWRLSGKVNIAGGLNIKPYICFSDFVVNPESGLILSQKDRFDTPQWDILVSAFFPFTIGKLTAPPAPPVNRTPPTLPKTTTKTPSSPWDTLFSFFPK